MKAHDLLKKYIKKNQKSSAAFSLRSLARRVDVSAPFLSRVLSGQKAMPETLFEKLKTALNVEPELFEKADEQSAKAESTRVPKSLEAWEIADLTADKILSHWFYLPILDFTTLANFDGREESISDRLGLPLSTVRAAIKDLIELGLLRRTEHGLSKVHEKIRFTGTKSLVAVRRFHAEMMDQAKLELRNATTDDDRNRRLISGITVTANPEAIERAKQKLNECLYEIANDLIDDHGTELYHIGLQFFPLTKK